MARVSASRMMKFATWIVTLLCVAVFADPVLAQSATTPLKITVYGGSGRIGQRIVTEALNRGHVVTVVARNADKTAAAHDRLKIVKGDILDSAGVARQVAGQDVLIAAVNNGEAPFFSNAATSAVTAVRGLGAKAPRFIWVGAAAVLKDDTGKTLYERTAEPKAWMIGQTQTLAYLRGIQDIHWTFFSPALSIQPGTRTGKFRLGGETAVTDNKGESRISTEDFAMATIDEAEKPQHMRVAFTIGY